ncbi:MAG TPA: glycosyltransferase family 39 protein [Candidatus Acidoferrales bacterium]|nr:glycosyltransferase family 39 protein [Candidatus Acidoferrales bacterium]
MNLVASTGSDAGGSIVSDAEGPGASKADSIIGIAVFVLSAAYLCLFFRFTALNSDEGISLQGAQRILSGQVLYRDFFAFYTPGSYYWTALLFRVFGSSFGVARAALIVYGGIFSTATFLLSRRVCSRVSSLLAAFAVAVSCLPFRFVVLHNWESTLLALLALYSAVVYFERPGKTYWAFCTGMFASLAFLFEQSKGAGIALGLALGFVLIGARTGDWTIFKRHQFCALLLGASWPVIATMIYFATVHALRPMLADWMWPFSNYSAANKLPYGFLVMSTADRGALLRGSIGSSILTLFSSGPIYVMAVLPLAAVLILAWFSYRGPTPDQNQRYKFWILSSSVMVGMLVSTLLTRRPDFTHLNYQGPIFYIALAWILGATSIRSRFALAIRPPLIAVAFLSFSFFGLALLWPALNAHVETQTFRGAIRTGQPDFALDFLLEHSRPGEEVFVYPYEPLYYFLSGTRSSLRYDFLQPGMHTPEQFRESAEELAEARPAIVLFEPTFREKYKLGWPNTPAEALEAPDPVSGYLESNYHACGSLPGNGFWVFTAMVPNGSGCPSDGRDADR